MSECFYCHEALDENYTRDLVRGVAMVAHRECTRARLKTRCDPPMSNIDGVRKFSFEEAQERRQKLLAYYRDRYARRKAARV